MRHALPAALAARYRCSHRAHHTLAVLRDLLPREAQHRPPLQRDCVLSHSVSLKCVAVGVKRAAVDLYREPMRRKREVEHCDDLTSRVDQWMVGSPTTELVPTNESRHRALGL
jgi:hypothetical protein